MKFVVGDFICGFKENGYTPLGEDMLVGKVEGVYGFSMKVVILKSTVKSLVNTTYRVENNYSKFKLLNKAEVDKMLNYNIKASMPIKAVAVDTTVKKEHKKNSFHKSMIKDVVSNGIATIVFWKDGTKTVVKCHNEVFDKEKALAMAIVKKMSGNDFDYYEVFKKWC